MTDVTFRSPKPADATAITAIDKQGLDTGHATFRDIPHDWDRFRTSFLEGRGFALVAEDSQGIAAWAGVGPTSARKVYEGVGETSIYVSRDRHNLGIGKRLLEELISASEYAGYWTLIAQIFPENKASLGLHASVGFECVGTRQRLGKMEYGPFAGRWRDVVLLERRSRKVG